MKTIRKLIKEKVEKVAVETYTLSDVPPFELSEPPSGLGDFSVNLAFPLAKRLKRSPVQIAHELSLTLGRDEMFQKVEVAGKGFLNFTLGERFILEYLKEAVQHEDFGRSDVRNGEKILVEFVSANPTGPLHVGHGRNAAVGDTISRILEFAGAHVTREFYINDAGGQIFELGRSVIARFLGRGEEDLQYSGEYIDEVVEHLKGENAVNPEDPYETGLKAAEVILNWIKEDLARFRVNISSYVSELRDIRMKGAVEEVIESLREKSLIFEEDGAVLFRADKLGDEKPRVLIKSNGEYTYFASDIAYHLEKLKRGYHLLVNIWGADHHGYLPRLRAAIQALGEDPEKLKVVFIQMVNLLREGKPYQMSKRRGDFVTLRELIDEIGVDSARFMYLTRKSEAHLDLDVENAKKKNPDNPVYYTQYAHARIRSIFREAEARNLPMKEELLLRDPAGIFPEDGEERSLIIRCFLFPHIVEDSAFFLEPHRLAYYLIELAKTFHGYYNRHRILVENDLQRTWRMLLMKLVEKIFKSGLSLLGVTAPERM